MHFASDLQLNKLEAEANNMQVQIRPTQRTKKNEKVPSSMLKLYYETLYHATKIGGITLMIQCCPLLLS